MFSLRGQNSYSGCVTWVWNGAKNAQSVCLLFDEVMKPEPVGSGQFYCVDESWGPPSRVIARVFTKGVSGFIVSTDGATHALPKGAWSERSVGGVVYTVCEVVTVVRVKIGVVVCDVVGCFGTCALNGKSVLYNVVGGGFKPLDGCYLTSFPVLGGGEEANRNPGYMWGGGVSEKEIDPGDAAMLSVDLERVRVLTLEAEELEERVRRAKKEMEELASFGDVDVDSEKVKEMAEAAERGARIEEELVQMREVRKVFLTMLEDQSTFRRPKRGSIFRREQFKSPVIWNRVEADEAFAKKCKEAGIYVKDGVTHLPAMKQPEPLMKAQIVSVSIGKAKAFVGE